MDKQMRKDAIEWWKTFGPGLEEARTKRGITMITADKVMDHLKLIKDV